jgi:hypothetical protein
MWESIYTYSINNLSNNTLQCNSTGTLNLAGTTFNSAINTDLYVSGSTIYIVMYGITSGDAGYQDVTTGNMVYPSLNPVGSNVASVVVP